MESIFLKILNLGLTAGIIVVVILLVKLLFHRAPRWIHCLLWALVAVRLVCPWTPSSPFGIIPAEIIGTERVAVGPAASGTSGMEQQESSVTEQQESFGEIPGSFDNFTEKSAKNVNEGYGMAEVPVVRTGITTVDERVNESLKESFTPIVGDSADPLQVYSFVFSVIWVAGMAAMALYAFFSWLSVKRRAREAVPYSVEDKEFNASEGLRVYLADGIPSPFILGFFRPVIYLPAAIRQEDAELVLAHERAHLLRRDHWWKPIGFLLLTVYWFNPLLWLAYIILCRDIEMACDEKVILKMGAESGRRYSETLLSLSLPKRRISACPLAFGEVSVKSRIKKILNYKKPAFWIVCIFVAVIAVVAMLLLTKPQGTDMDGAGSKKAEKAELLKNASPDTSAISFLYYDGEKTFRKLLIDKEEEKRIVEEINGLYMVKTDSSRAAEMKPPCYGIDIADTDGMDIWLTYSNGLWLLKDESVYEAEFDFEKLYESVPERDDDIASDGGSAMLNSAILGKYDLQFYAKAKECGSEKDGISLSVASVEGDVVTVTLTNNSDSEFGYGDDFALQKEIDGVWYILPPKLSNYGFNDILHLLPAGESGNAECWLTMYGELEPGNYRIAKADLAAEFRLDGTQGGEDSLKTDDMADGGSSDTDAPKEADSDTDAPKEADSDTDAPKEADSDADTPKETDSDADTPKEADSDADTPKEADSDTDAPKETDSDTDAPKEADSDTDAPKEAGKTAAGEGTTVNYGDFFDGKKGAEDYRDIEKVKKYLAALPNDRKLLEKYEVLVESDTERAGQLWNSFADRVNAGEPAVITIAQFTEHIEDSPEKEDVSAFIDNFSDAKDAIFYYIYYDGERFYSAEDKSRCNFGTKWEIQLMSTKYLFTYTPYPESMTVVMTDDAELTYEKYDSMLRYLQYADFSGVPMWIILSGGGSRNRIAATPVDTGSYSDVVLSERGLVNGEYVTAELCHMSMLSSSIGNVGTEVYVFTDEGYSVYPRYDDDKTVMVSEGTVYGEWKDGYTPEEWAEMTEWDMGTDSLYQRLGLRDCKRMQYSNGTELIMVNDRLYIMRPGNKYIWSVYELKRLAE